MQLRAEAIVLQLRHHGETGAICRLMTREAGLVAGYVAGARGRRMRPVLIPGNRVDLDLRARYEGQLPFARVELVESRGPWLGEPLAAAAIGWISALGASALPERSAYPALYDALGAVLDAVCHAPSARGWLVALNGFEDLLLRELGYGASASAAPRARGKAPARGQKDGAIQAQIARFDARAAAIENYLLAESHGDVMAARHLLRERLGRMLA